MPMHERLAYVYTSVGAANLAAFYAALTRRGDLPGVSYEACRTYHGPKRRTPPVEYLQRIVETFPQFDALWLLTGRGDPERTFPRPVSSKETRDAFIAAAGHYVDYADDISPAVLEAAERLAGKAVTLMSVYGAFEAYDRDESRRDKISARTRAVRIGLAKRLGEACAMSAVWLLSGDATKYERAIPLDTFAQRFIIAAEELVPLWTDAQLTPAERKARRAFKDVLRGHQPRDGGDDKA